MNNILKTISILVLVIITLLSALFNINNYLILALEIVFSSIFIFYIGKESNKKKGFIKFFIIFLFWNITYFVIKNGIFISNDKLLDIIVNSILLKNIYLNILPAIAFGYLLNIFTFKKKYINIVFQIILIILAIYLKNIIFLLCAVFLFGRLFKNKNIIHTSFFDFFNNINFTTYILHKFILELLMFLNIIKTNSISDFFGSLIIIYIISLIFRYFMIYLPIIKNLIKE